MIIAAAHPAVRTNERLARRLKPGGTHVEAGVPAGYATVQRFLHSFANWGTGHFFARFTYIMTGMMHRVDADPDRERSLNFHTIHAIA